MVKLILNTLLLSACLFLAYKTSSPSYSVRALFSLLIALMIGGLVLGLCLLPWQTGNDKFPRKYFRSLNKSFFYVFTAYLLGYLVTSLSTLI